MALQDFLESCFKNTVTVLTCNNSIVTALSSSCRNVSLSDLLNSDIPVKLVTSSRKLFHNLIQAQLVHGLTDFWIQIVRFLRVEVGGSWHRNSIIAPLAH